MPTDVPPRPADDVVALVTGAASGMGAAVATGFCASGARVALADRNASAVEAIGDLLADRNGEAMSLVGDVADREGVDRWTSEVLARWGRIDVLVNCAGVLAPKAAVDVEQEEWEAVIRTNLTGTFNTCQSVGRHMLARKAGSIINFTSIAGVRGALNRVAYATSKHAIIGLTRVLAHEWAPSGVRVNAIGPGLIKTPMNSYGTSIASAVIARVPMGRLAEADEVVGSVLFLASPEAAYVTGQVIFVDGGFLVT